MNATNKLWTKKQEKVMRNQPNKFDNMVKAVDTYLKVEKIEKVNIWIHKISVKCLTYEQKIIFYYNQMASKEENFLKNIHDYSWTGQIDFLEYLVGDSQELKDLFVKAFLGSTGIGLLCDISDFRDYVRNELGRGKNITLIDFKACINEDDLRQSDWYTFSYLMSELYLKPCHLINMEYIYNALMMGFTLEDFWAWYEICPEHPLQFITFSVDYAKEKARLHMERLGN